MIRHHLKWLITSFVNIYQECHIEPPTNFAIKAELVLASILTFICTQTIRYWHTIIKLDSNRILRSIYQSELEIHNAGGTLCATFVAKLLEIIGHDSSLHTPKQYIIKQSTSMKSEVNNEIAGLYFLYNFKSICEHCKLSTYVKFKTGMGMEKYLDLEGLPQNNRKHFCAFRISCYNLEIERGQYSIPPKLPEERDL